MDWPTIQQTKWWAEIAIVWDVTLFMGYIIGWCAHDLKDGNADEGGLLPPGETDEMDVERGGQAS